jgi:farnesyl-diphosphate farnesyltransferase
MEQVETVSDYNEYCHYAAGLAGLGLSRLFYASGLEEFPPDILSNSMGLFIQVPVMYHMCRHAFP